jgi:peroxiredoxin Q/BCP
MTDLKPLEVGVDAPDLEMEDADGVVHRLRDYIGVKNVVLAFYPKDFTSG